MLDHTRALSLSHLLCQIICVIVCYRWGGSTGRFQLLKIKTSLPFLPLQDWKVRVIFNYHERVAICSAEVSVLLKLQVFSLTFPIVSRLLNPQRPLEIKFSSETSGSVPPEHPGGNRLGLKHSGCSYRRPSPSEEHYSMNIKCDILSLRTSP